MNFLVNRLDLHALIRWRPGALARTGVELWGWLMLRAAAQALTIIGLARLLGAIDYGSFVAVIAIAATFSSVAGLGLPSVLLRDGSRLPTTISTLLGRSLAVSLVAILFIAALATIVVIVVLPGVDASMIAVSAIVLTEISSTCLIELVGRAFQAQQKIRIYGALQSGLPCFRLAALFVLVTIKSESLESWLWTYTMASFVYTLFAVLFTKRAIGWSFSNRRLLALVREGIPFATGAASTRLQAEYNKPLLAQAGLSQAGYFNLAQRAVDLVSLPLLALQDVLWPRLYRADDHHRQLLLSGTLLVLMSLAGTILVIAASLFITGLLGQEYQPVAGLMILLSGLPVLATLRSLGNFHLIATNRTHLITWVYAAGAASSLVFATLWIPDYSLAGAAFACYAAEIIALLCILALAIATR